MSAQTIDYYDHPVFNPIRLHLETPPMKNLEHILQGWLWSAAVGGLIWGTSRIGKTRAMRRLIDKIRTRGNQAVPVYYVSMPKRDRPTIQTVYWQMNHSFGLSYKKTDTTNVLSDNVVHYIVEQAVLQQCEFAIIIIDEVQRLNIPQLNAFAEIYDKLEYMEIVCMFVFVGNDPEVWSLIEEVEKPKNSHLYGRFFKRNNPYTGLQSASEVRECLRQYDDSLHFPEGGPTYTEYFLPGAYKSGWRLSRLSGQLWQIFADYKREYKIQSWGMSYFLFTVNSLLTDYLPNIDVESLDDSLIDAAIQASNLVPELVSPIPHD